VRGTWEAVRERLSRYSLAQVLDILGRVSAVLAQGQSSRDIQHRLLLGLFDDAAAARILAAIERQAAQLKKEGFGDLTTVMFDELQIVNTAKAALLTLPADGADVPDMSFAALGEVFLMVSDLIEEAPGSLGGVDIHTDEGWQTALQYLLVNSLFHHSQHELHVLARCHDLYLQDKPRLAGCGSYVDLPALVRSATGLGPDALWAVLFAILGHTISQGARPEQAAPIRRADYFTRHFGFTVEESEAFFNLLTIDAAAMKSKLAKFYSPSDMKPFHMLPLAQFPLIGIGEHVFCPSRHLLLEALTHGLYHRLLNAPGRSETERHQFMTYVGEVFGDYVDRLLVRTFGSSPLLRRYIEAAELRSALPGKKGQQPPVCDGVLLYGDAVVLIETKAKFFSLAARTGESYEEYDKKLDEIFVGAARQMHATIDAIEGGALRALGLDPAHIKAYFPVIVSLERLPLRGPIYGHVTKQIGLAGLLDQPAGRVRPVQLLEADDLEIIEPALANGVDLRELLQRKIDDERFIGETFINFAPGVREKRLAARNEYLSVAFRDLGDRAKAFFKSRSRSTESAETQAPEAPEPR